MFIIILEPCQTIKKFQICSKMPELIRKMIAAGDFEVLRVPCDKHEKCVLPQRREKNG